MYFYFFFVEIKLLSEFLKEKKYEKSLKGKFHKRTKIRKKNLTWFRIKHVLI